MASKRTYYQILYVHEDAPTKIITSSYRTLMQQLNAHPDRGGDETEAALINRAYAVLSISDKRTQYDRDLEAMREAAGNPGTPRYETIQLSVGPICPFCSSKHIHGKNIPEDAVCANCNSPLKLGKEKILDKTGQRKIRRFDQRENMHFYTEWPQSNPHQGVMMDFSPRGMMFETSTEIFVNTVLKIDCSRFKAIGQVVNCRQMGKLMRPNWRIGIQFITIQFKSTRGTFISDTA